MRWVGAAPGDTTTEEPALKYSEETRTKRAKINKKNIMKISQEDLLYLIDGCEVSKEAFGAAQ